MFKNIKMKSTFISAALAKPHTQVTYQGQCSGQVNLSKQDQQTHRITKSLMQNEKILLVFKVFKV
jgi:hypothetical protein